MKKYLFIPLMVLPTVLASCNSNSHINRTIFNETSCSNAFNVHNAMKTKQISEDAKTTLFDKGSVTYKYSVTLKGTLRYDDLSFHNINLSLSAGYKISWSKSDEFIKVEGEKESDYFVKNKADNTYWQCHKNIVNGEEKRVRNEITEDIPEEGFANYIVDTINHYCSIEVPLVLSITAGITGDPIDTTGKFDISPDTIFEKSNYDLFAGLSQKYKQDNKGYYLNLTYGSNDQNTVSALMKGKLNANDFHETSFRQGEITLDSFISFKNNFVSQFEIIFDATTLNLRTMYNTNIDTHIYMSQETKENDCEVEQIDINNYEIDE